MIDYQMLSLRVYHFTFKNTIPHQSWDYFLIRFQYFLPVYEGVYKKHEIFSENFMGTSSSTSNANETKQKKNIQKIETNSCSILILSEAKSKPRGFKVVVIYSVSSVRISLSPQFKIMYSQYLQLKLKTKELGGAKTKS